MKPVYLPIQDVIWNDVDGDLPRHSMSELLFTVDTAVYEVVGRYVQSAIQVKLEELQ